MKTALSLHIDFAAAAKHHRQVAKLWHRNVAAAMSSVEADRFDAEVLADDARLMRDMHASLAETIQTAAEGRFGAEAFADAVDELESGGTEPLFHDGWPVPGHEEFTL